MIRLNRMVAVLVIGAATLALAASQQGPRRPASLQFLVLKDSNGKPVRNAEIVLHPLDEHGHEKSEGLELKTHEDGKAQVAGIPYGKLRVQVIASGFQTYGEDFDINQPNQEFTIRMQKPHDPYSIYK